MHITENESLSLKDWLETALNKKILAVLGVTIGVSTSLFSVVFVKIEYVSNPKFTHSTSSVPDPTPDVPVPTSDVPDPTPDTEHLKNPGPDMKKVWKKYSRRFPVKPTFVNDPLDEPIH